MTNGSKTLLKIFLLAYGLLAVLSVLDSFNIKGLEEVLKISYISLPMTTVILLAYVMDRGDDGLAKIGILCLLVTMVITVLTSFGIVKTTFESNDMTSKIVDTVRSIASGGLSICSMLALFSLIPVSDDRSSILKVTAVLAYVVYVLINVSGNFIDLHEIKFLTGVRSLCIHVSNFSEYAFIITYLLNKKIDPVAENMQVMNQPSIVEEPAPAPQQQPLFQQAPMYNEGQVEIPAQAAADPNVNTSYFTTPVYQPGVATAIPQVSPIPDQVATQTTPVTTPTQQPVQAPTGPVIPQIVMPTTPQQ